MLKIICAFNNLLLNHFHAILYDKIFFSTSYTLAATIIYCQVEINFEPIFLTVIIHFLLNLLLFSFLSYSQQLKSDTILRVVQVILFSVYYTIFLCSMNQYDILIRAIYNHDIKFVDISAQATK